MPLPPKGELLNPYGFDYIFYFTSFCTAILLLLQVYPEFIEGHPSTNGIQFNC